MSLDRETVERWVADNRREKAHIPDDRTEGYGWFESSRLRTLAAAYLEALDLLTAATEPGVVADVMTLRPSTRTWQEQARAFLNGSPSPT